MTWSWLSKIWLMDKASGVTIGTPEDLSLDGSLSRFFARKGIVFDLETGLFRMDNEYTSQIRLAGHGQRYAMVRKALQRNGIQANRNVESAVFIETGDLRGDAPFVFHRADGTMVTVSPGGRHYGHCPQHQRIAGRYPGGGLVT